MFGTPWVDRLNHNTEVLWATPATWVWLAASLVAVGVCVYVGFWLLRDYWSELDQWLSLAFGGVAAWIIFGWIWEMIEASFTGHLGNTLHWQEPVMIVGVFGLGYPLSRWLSSILFSRNRGTQSDDPAGRWHY